MVSRFSYSFDPHYRAKWKKARQPPLKQKLIDMKKNFVEDGMGDIPIVVVDALRIDTNAQEEEAFRLNSLMLLSLMTEINNSDPAMQK